MKKIEEYVRSIPDFPSGESFSGTLPASCRMRRIKTGDRFHAGISEGCGRGCDRGNRVKRLYVRSTYCL